MSGASAWAKAVKLNGDISWPGVTQCGSLPGQPSALGAATKAYVDAHAGSGGSAPVSMVDHIAERARAVKCVSSVMCRSTAIVTTGDCRVRDYYLDTADSSSADNGGTIIVASDGGRWKIIDKRILTVRMFGAKGGGTQRRAAVTTAINYAASNGVPIIFDGNFSVTSVVISGKAGLHIKGQGGLVGIASASTSAVLEFVNCTDISINER